MHSLVPPHFVRLCRLAELDEGSSRGFDPWQDGHDSIFVVRHRGELYAWRDACPHYGDTPMAWRKDSYLDAQRTRIVCAAHGAQFDIETGVCTLGPCVGQALKAVDIMTTEQDIFVGSSLD